MKQKQRYSPELKAEAVKLVLEQGLRCPDNPRLKFGLLRETSRDA